MFLGFHTAVIAVLLNVRDSCIVSAMRRIWSVLFAMKAPWTETFF